MPDPAVMERVHALPTWAKARLRWRVSRRPTQRAPDGGWLVWLIMAGRGWGKTRTGAEWVAEQAELHPGTRWAVVAPTFADARDTCVEGESGLLYCLGEPPKLWNRSIGELELANGSRVRLFSAEEPDRLRGHAHAGAWCDELGAWREPETWDQLQFTLRSGDQPRTVVTTTPRPTSLVRRLVDRGDVAVTRGHTSENADNLAVSALEELLSTYEGTRLGRQELAGELLLDTPGALWRLAEIEAARQGEPVDGFDRIVVGVDPAVTAHEGSDETGIIVAGRLGEEFWVLDDRSGRYSPDGWASVVVGLLDEWEADRVVAEVNHGHDLVEHTLRTVDASVPLTRANASRGKRVRAEPVAALYEQGRVHHVGVLDRLEDQLCSWTPESRVSPDRLDALVWALSELSGGRRGRRGAPVVRAA